MIPKNSTPPPDFGESACEDFVKCPQIHLRCKRFSNEEHTHYVPPVIHPSASSFTCQAVTSHTVVINHMCLGYWFIYTKTGLFPANYAGNRPVFRIFGSVAHSDQLRLRRVRTMASVTSAANATATMSPATTITFEPVLACLVAVFVIVTSVESRSTATT